MVTKLKLLEGRAVIPPVGGEILVKRRSESETDHGNVAAKRDDQARQEQLMIRRRIARASCHRASGGRDARCNSPCIPSACAYEWQPWQPLFWKKGRRYDSFVSGVRRPFVCGLTLSLYCWRLSKPRA